MRVQALSTTTSFISDGGKVLVKYSKDRNLDDFPIVATKPSRSSDWKCGNIASVGLFCSPGRPEESANKSVDWPNGETSSRND